MIFRTLVSSGKEVMFVGRERGDSQSLDGWVVPVVGWKISISALDEYLTENIKSLSFGSSISKFVFCFEIADFEKWSKYPTLGFTVTANFTSYRPKKKEILSVGQIRWSDVKDLDATSQLQALRNAVKSAIHRVGTKKRKPKDFDNIAFADTIDILLEKASIKQLQGLLRI